MLIREVHSSKRCHPRYPVLHNEQCHPLLPGQPAEGHQGAGGEECLAGDPSQEPADWEGGWHAGALSLGRLLPYHSRNISHYHTSNQATSDGM